jgi:hypothetical protein
MPGDHLSAATRRRLSRSPFAPLPGDDNQMAQLRTDVAARLLLERIITLGPQTEPDILEQIESRAPGRAHEILAYARGAGMVRRIPGLGDQPAMIAPTHVEHRPIAA